MAERNALGHIYSVTALSREIKTLIEENYPFVWITGEISNYSVPASGHAYFSLKDKGAVINCVMFRNQKKRLTFEPENGMKIIGMGRISLYEPRGSYQLILEHINPEGIGAAQAAFEQLKKNLSKEGLFDLSHKKPLPFIPSCVSLITSGTGAVVKDIITIATRRFPNCRLKVLPVKVQGKSADLEIESALELANQRMESDLIILARGGGSLEDLAAFNSEIVARAVFASIIPVVSAVGHETDVTITDFVSDLRAPTPSAAAEMAFPDKKSIIKELSLLQKQLEAGIGNIIFPLKERVTELDLRLKSPERLMDDLRFRQEELETRLVVQMEKTVALCRERLNWHAKTLFVNTPQQKMPILYQLVDNLNHRLRSGMEKQLEQVRARAYEITAMLEALSPMAILERGYSITRHYPGKTVLLNSDEINQGDTLEVLLAKGRLLCRVEGKNG